MRVLRAAGKVDQLRRNWSTATPTNQHTRNTQPPLGAPVFNRLRRRPPEMHATLFPAFKAEASGPPAQSR